MGARVAVIGGGISGLSAAWHLAGASPGLDVTVLEASDRVGGKLRLEHVGDVVVDVGAESVLARRPEAIELFEQLGLAARITHPAAIPAAIYSGGRCWPVPRRTVMGVPSDPESVRGILTDSEVERLLSEPATPPVIGDLTVGDLVDQRLGPAVTDKLVEPLLAGVYAGHARDISLEMAVPALAAAARTGSSLLATARTLTQSTSPTPVFASVSGGLGVVPLLLATRLAELGVSLRTSTIVRRLERRGSELVVTSGPTTGERDDLFDAVVLATPARPTARLLMSLAPAAAARLAAIEYASMAIVTFVLDGPPPDVLEGSGILVAPSEALTIKASTFSTLKWPWLAAAHPDHTVLRASIGRHREEGTLHRTDEELVAVARADLATVLGRPLPTPRASQVQRWGGALPQYAVGHRGRMAGITEPAPAIALSGAAYDGVGIPACIASGRRAAAAILTRLREDRPELG